MTDIEVEIQGKIKLFNSKYNELTIDVSKIFLDKRRLKIAFHLYLYNNQDRIESLFIQDLEQYNILKEDILDLFETMFINIYAEFIQLNSKDDLILFIMMMKRKSNDFKLASVLKIDEEYTLRVDKILNKSKKGCYIATMAYGDYNHPQVLILRKFRDEKLSKSAFGSWFIKTYYRFSPLLVEKLKDVHWINRFVRTILNLIIKIIKQ